MIANNVTLSMIFLPDKNNGLKFDGTYSEQSIITKNISGEMRVVKKLEYNNPAGQPIDAILGIKYKDDINKDRTRLKYNDKIYRILTIKPSPLIYPDWKLLEIQEVYE